MIDLYIKNGKTVAGTKIDIAIKNANASYKNIFKAVTPFIIPPNLKNGRCSYKNTDIGFFK